MLHDYQIIHRSIKIQDGRAPATVLRDCVSAVRPGLLRDSGGACAAAAVLCGDGWGDAVGDGKRLKTRALSVRNPMSIEDHSRWEIQHRVRSEVVDEKRITRGYN
nr:hypothetical protein Iba_chr08dCG12140 [Ipomoea batatas]